jgi:PAS domain-containing protein
MSRPTPDNAEDRAAGLASQQGTLRLRAEQSLPAFASKTTRDDSAPDSQRLLHELQVHQIELELQNEELLASRAEVEGLLTSYRELYDFSPVAYFTLEQAGKILQANPAAARLLGVERAQLSQRRLGVFILPQDLPVLNSLLQRVFDGQSRNHC